MTMRLTSPPACPLSGPVPGAGWGFLSHVTPCLGRATPLAGSPPTRLSGRCCVRKPRPVWPRDDNHAGASFPRGGSFAGPGDSVRSLLP